MGKMDVGSWGWDDFYGAFCVFFCARQVGVGALVMERSCGAER